MFIYDFLCLLSFNFLTYEKVVYSKNISPFPIVVLLVYFCFNFCFLIAGDWPDMTILEDPESRVPVTAAVIQITRGVSSMTYLVLGFDGIPSTPIDVSTISARNVSANHLESPGINLIILLIFNAVLKILNCY